MKLAAGCLILRETPLTTEERVARAREAGMSEERITKMVKKLEEIEKAMEDPDYDDRFQ